MIDDELDKPREECGVFAVFSADAERDVAPLVYYGLFSLQHRGQESAGIAVAKNGVIECRKGMGLVGDVFKPEALRGFHGSSAVGHVRYSTAGESAIENAQPFVSRFKLGSIAVAHNGT
ncbi:MAG: class II glutamine amidotransferase, partial [Treponema sp.]|nr:class II glutamine amidotransferase [Treponema sp.]